MYDELMNDRNIMAINRKTQVRSIAEVTKAVALADLIKKFEIETRGEIVEFKNIVNDIVGQLRVFAFEVTRMSKTARVEGTLGGRASVHTWQSSQSM